MKKLLGIGIVGLLLICGCKKASRSTTNELEQLQGDWVIERLEVSGNTLPMQQVKDKNYTLKGNNLIPSQNPDDPATLSVRPEKQPAWIDLTDRDNITMLGIYRIDGDRWEICAAQGDERPTGFTTSPANKTVLMVLRRKGK